MVKVLILGAQGMLGQELVRAYAEDTHVEVATWDIDDIDVTDTRALREKTQAFAPSVIYNAIAYNAVDLCEESDEEYAKTQLLNVTYPGELAKIATEVGATIVHYSSDYVFSGDKPESSEQERPEGCCGGGCCGGTEIVGGDYPVYNEHDVPDPVSRYGQSKYDGELAVAEHAPGRSYIIRLSKLFGRPADSAVGKRSFFDVMLEKGREGGEIKAIDAERSKFTYAPDLAQESKMIVEEGCDAGIYHIVNEGAVTWYEGVEALYKIAEIDVSVMPVGADTFPRPAKRPTSSVLTNTKRPPLRHYEDALKEYLKD